MQRKFDNKIAGLFPDSGTVLLAVSGGTDSMALASLFLHSSAAPPFAVAHCNFHLRGSESDADAKFVRDWCVRHRVRFHEADFDTEEYSRAHGVSIEMAARELRYGFFDRLCREHSYDAVCVAHNAGDNVETLLLNLLRGTGVKGMTGMKEVSVLPVHGSEISLIRPLLAFSRAELSSYLKSLGETFREDSTNASNDYKRNKIRNLVFPVFEEINPSFLSAVERGMANIRQVAGIADSYYAEASVSVASEDGLRISISKLMALKHWEYVLYKFMERYSMPSSAFSDLCRTLASGASSAGRSFIAGEHRIVLSSSEIIVSSNIAAAPEETVVVRGDGVYEIGGRRFIVETVPFSRDMDLRQPEGSIVFDSAAMPFPFLVRGWREGDWMVPFGMKGRKKLSDMFVDMKLSLVDKSTVLVAVSPSMSGDDDSRIHVAAVLGRRIDDSLRVSESSVTVTAVRFI